MIGTGIFLGLLVIGILLVSIGVKKRVHAVTAIGTLLFIFGAYAVFVRAL